MASITLQNNRKKNVTTSRNWPTGPQAHLVVGVVVVQVSDNEDVLHVAGGQIVVEAERRGAVCRVIQ